MKVCIEYNPATEAVMLYVKGDEQYKDENSTSISDSLYKTHVKSPSPATTEELLSLMDLLDSQLYETKKRTAKDKKNTGKAQRQVVQELYSGRSSKRKRYENE